VRRRAGLLFAAVSVFAGATALFSTTAASTPAFGAGSSQAAHTTGSSNTQTFPNGLVAPTSTGPGHPMAPCSKVQAHLVD
jgi:hypothetical protein